MLRPILFGVVVLALQGIPLAQQVQPHGVPSSVTSPSPDGTLHGVPASITSPTPVTGANRRIAIAPGSRRIRVHFGNPRVRARREFVPVPIFIPAYQIDTGYSEADPPVAGEYAPSDSEQTGESEALREAYNRGAQDALTRQQSDPRYGEHYLDSREQGRQKPAPANQKAAEKPAPAPEPQDDSPAAVFVFKDGHKIQTHNYAIVGQTLIDLSNQGLKKIQLADLDLDATRKANDDLGVYVKLP